MQVRDPEAARRSRVAVHLYLFDVLHAAGHDLTRLGLRHRKGVLRRLLAFHDRLRFTPTATPTARPTGGRPAARAGRA
jgi:bifunctional non-homologous end joining protein LigD